MASGGHFDSATAVAGEEEKRKLITCTVCLQPYTQPRYLPCLHTFCLPCLQRLATPADQTAPLRGSQSKGLIPRETAFSVRDQFSPFACPTCRRTVIVPPGGVVEFQINFAMEAEVARQTSSVLTCDMCDGAAVADVGCTECQKRLCASCRQVHDQVAGAASHSLTPLLQDITTEKAWTKLKSYRGGSSRRNICKIHGQEVILFCIQCNVTLCRQCQNTSHGGHVTEQLTAVMEKQRAEMRRLLQEIQKRVKAEEEVIQKTNKEEQDLERQKQEVVGQAVEAAGKVTAWANQAEDKVVAQINDASAPIRTKLLTLKNAALERKTALDQLRDRARLAMQSGSLGELESLTQQMKRALSTQVVCSQPEHEGSGPKQTQFFRRLSSGQELLQNAVPRFIGEVIPVGGGQPNTQGENRQGAWLFYLGNAPNKSISGLRTTATELQSLICTGQSYYNSPRYHTQSFTIADSPAGPIHNQGNYAFGCCSKIQGATSLPSTELLLLADGAFYTGPDFGNVVQATVRGPSLPSQSALLSRDAMASDRRVYMLDTKYPNENNMFGVYEIQELTLTPPATVTAQPLFQTVHASQPQAFDASSDGSYRVIVWTTDHYLGGTDGNVYVKLDGDVCQTAWHYLDDACFDNFERSSGDSFTFQDVDIGSKIVDLWVHYEAPIHLYRWHLNKIDTYYKSMKTCFYWQDWVPRSKYLKLRRIGSSAFAVTASMTTVVVLVVTTWFLT